MLRLAIVILLGAFGFSADGAEVHRCVTDAGVVRYSDKPCNDGRNEKLDIESRPTDSSAVKEQTEQRKAEIAELDATQAQAAESAAKAAKEAEQRSTQCAAARDRLQKLMSARRVTKGEGENLEYLDSAGVLEQQQQAQDKVNEFCGK